MRWSILCVCLLGCGAAPRPEPQEPLPGPREAELEEARVERAYLRAAERRELELLGLPALAVRGGLVSDADVQEYASAHEDALRAAFERSERGALEVHSRHLLCETREACEAARARIVGGEDFAAVAQEVTIDHGSAPRGGDLGFHPRGRMVEPFDAVVFALPVGEVSAVFQTQFGFHVAQVLGRRGGDTTFEGQRLGLAREALRAERDLEATQRLLQERARPALEAGRSLDEVAASLDEQRYPVRRAQATLAPGQAVNGVEPPMAARLAAARDGEVIGPFPLVDTLGGLSRAPELVLIRVRVVQADTVHMTAPIAACLRDGEACESRACTECVGGELAPVDLLPGSAIPPEIMEQILRQLRAQDPD